MRIVHGYIFRQIAAPSLFFFVLLSAITWMLQSLRLLDMVTGHGQSFLTFLELSLLASPAITGVILPIALVCGTLYGLYRLYADNELAIFWAASLDRFQLARPLFHAGIYAFFLVLFFNTIASPWSSRILKEEMFQIQADFVLGVIQEGVFNTPLSGMTVYIQKITKGGEMHGLMLHDSRDPLQIRTFLAERSALVKTDGKPFLVMFNGHIQTKDPEKQLSSISFERFNYDLSSFVQKEEQINYKPREMFLNELLWPSKDLPLEQQHRLIARGHQQITSSLYPLCFMVIIAVGMLYPLGPRGNVRRRMIAVASGLLIVQIMGLSLENSVGNDLYKIILTYAFPVCVIGAGLIILRKDLFLISSTPKA